MADLDPEREPPALERFRELLRIPTMSRPEVADTDWDAFTAFHDALERLYPLVHSTLEREVVADWSLVYRLPGQSSERPTVLMAHQDVVPADDSGWTHPPFAATLTDEADGRRLWGRGTIDDKGMLVAILEAVESALAAGVVPQRDVYLTFGHDEETGGTGIAAVVSLLESRGVVPGLVLDEGGAVVEKVFPGIEVPTAMIGVTEKGMASVELLVRQRGGHASTPPVMTATMRLARAIMRVGNQPAPASLPEPTLAMLETLAPHAHGPQALVFRRARRLRRPLLRLFDRLGPETAALIRTTRAVTRLSGSAGDNVLAETARAIVNVRVAVDSTLDEALAQIVAAVGDDEVAVTLVHGSEPSPVSPSSGPAWDLITSTIGEVFPDAVPTPYVMLAASDSRWFARISPNVYRFSPFRLSRSDRDALHAIDESISVDTWFDGVRFFEGLLRRV